MDLSKQTTERNELKLKTHMQGRISVPQLQPAKYLKRNSRRPETSVWLIARKILNIFKFILKLGYAFQILI
jgi:hypothetical protein